MNSKKFVHPDSLGQTWGVVSAEQLWAKVYAIKYNRPERKLTEEEQWFGLLAQAKSAALDFGAESIETRIRLEYEAETSGPECIAIGFQNNQPCALVVVQINKESGWSRISYMGLLPSHRNKGLGKWVHRYGFKMMKEQGGKRYHGGTHSENKAMRKLFESHGCHVFCEMEEWAFFPGGRPS